MMGRCCFGVKQEIVKLNSKSHAVLRAGSAQTVVVEQESLLSFNTSAMSFVPQALSRLLGTYSYSFTTSCIFDAFGLVQCLLVRQL